MDEFQDFVTVKTFWSSYQANIVKSFLENEGITCFLKDEFTVNADPLITNAIGGVKLQVPSSEYELAYTKLDQNGYINPKDKIDNTLQSKLEGFLRRVFNL
jgi:hypothetical protein